VDVQTPSGAADQIKEQLGALNIVLYFFSGIALFVGGFLILNSFNMTVLQRMREIGMLRTLGASRRMVTRTVLLEALAIGAVGTVVGLGIGIGLAAGLITLIRSIGVPVGRLQVPPEPALIAAFIGIAVALAGAFWPARRAGRTSPVRAAMGNFGLRARPSVARGLVGAALFIPGAVLGGQLWFGSNSGSAAEGIAGMAVTVTMFVGMALLAPFVILPIIRVLAVPLRLMSPAGGRLASDAVRSNAARTAATAAALMIGLSVVVVNSSMSSSFLGTIKTQLDRNFARDFNVQAQGFTLEQGGGPGVPRAVVERVRRFPEARAVVPIQALNTKLPEGRGQPGLITAFDPALYGLVDKTPVKSTTRDVALAKVARGGILVGPMYAKAAGLKAGSAITLRGANGTRRVRVAGVLENIGEFAGYQMQLSSKLMREVYGQTSTAQLAVLARSESQRPALERRMTALIRHDYPNLELQSAAGKKKEVNDEITTQFNMFNAIVAIAVIVSILGVINTLAMSVLERTREIGVMRALGSSRWQVRRTMLHESLLITSAGAAAGLGIGLLVGWLWVLGLGALLPGIAFHVPVGTVVGVALAAIAGGVLAAILPARRAAHLKVIEALSYE
jgi:putative ABC transport system permease protein